ncbi:MAG: M20/M25/M40 family metallo-hydrolase [Rubrivivax sp.]|nr:M20/M25/M40 family metallo-hydrolase [Rubrivivax sp.]
MLAAAALAACGGAQAQGITFAEDDLRHAARLRDLALHDGQAWALLQQLCTEVGARPAGSAADAKAVAWAQAALQRLGLQQVRAEPLPIRIWQRGPASALLLHGSAAAEPLVMTALGNSVAAPPEGIEAEIAWYPDLAALRADGHDAASSRASGRIVFIDQKTERTIDGRGYGAAVMARVRGAVEAARRGALALGIRSIGTDRQPVAHTGAMGYEIGVPRIPAFAVSVPDAERIAALHGAGTLLRLRLQLQAQSGVEAVTHNVIGEVPGTDLADEVVLISAHLDSWDLGQGAQDDGAGVAIVSAAAALLQRAGVRPRRTVRVVLFGNEENGFDGARAYGDRYGSVVHQLVSESDFGAGLVWQLRGRVQPAALPLVEAMAGVLAPLGVAWPAEGANLGSPGPDAALLMRRHRWPAVQLSQDGTNYFDVHHTANDTLDRIDPATLPQNVACWAVVAWLAAQAPLRFGPPSL